MDPAATPLSSRDAALQSLWEKWQPRPDKADKGEKSDKTEKPEKSDKAEKADKSDKASKTSQAIDLSDFDPGAKPFSLGNGKAEDKAAVEALAEELDALQNLLYADRRFKLLVVLQGTDTAGKDGTVRGVFGRMSALGVHAQGWRAPTETERAHDYLWRIHQQVPGNGEITVFNRSHYEDVLVPVVNEWITPEQQRQRFAHINDFERMLSETGTVVIKFLLHISADEQRARLQERLDDPAKHWKFDENDMKVRTQWKEYQQAYGQLLAATHTPWAPWTIVPADSKTHRNLMIATLLREVMRNLELRFPPGDPALKDYKIT